MIPLGRALEGVGGVQQKHRNQAGVRTPYNENSPNDGDTGEVSDAFSVATVTLKRMKHHQLTSWVTTPSSAS